MTDQSLTVTETVTAVRTENGDTAVYTATFTNSAFETQTKTVDIFYYLIGSMTEWAVNENYAFTVNPAVAGEYWLQNIVLAEGDLIKVVRAEGSNILAWYPDNAANYYVDYAHSGNVNVYFRPAGNYWNDFHTGGYFFISKLHEVTVTVIGSGEANVTSNAPDFTETITVGITPATGWHFDKIEFYQKTGNGADNLVPVSLEAIDWNEEAHTFKMPDYDLVIKVYFVINTYTVTWKNYNGTILETDENVPYGTTPSYDGATPEKEGNAQYTYTFAGWDPAIASVTGDVTYTAKFTETVNTYTVTWKNYDGTELEKDENVPYGTVPTYDGSTPTKPGDAEHNYTFHSWDPAISEVQGDITYTATFTEATNTYTVTWNNSDGTTLETDENVPYGTMPSYDGATPTKEATAQYTYTFSGWTPNIAPVTGNVTYTATFNQTVNKYTIKFVNEDGTVLQSGEVAYGETPVYNGETPAKEASAQYTYTFAGWDPEVTSVTGEATYTATYTATLNQYTVRFVNDGTVISETKYGYGTPAADIEVPADPTKEADAQYTYTFAGWDPAIAEVTADATYTATYTTTLNQYKVTFVDDDNTVISEKMYDYGTSAADIVKPADPTKEGDAQYTYTFAGWTPDIADVTENATYTATYTQSVNEYTITWIVDGEPVTSEVEYGQTPVYPGGDPSYTDGIYDYVLTGWTDGEYTYTDGLPEVNGEASYTAVFDKVLNTKELTITVTLAAAEEMDRMFIFNVVRNNAVVVKVPVIVKKGETSATVKIKGLAKDTYTVTEVTDWSWTHTVTTGSFVVDLNDNAAITFKNTKKPEVKWLNAEAYILYDPKRGY